MVTLAVRPALPEPVSQLAPPLSLMHCNRARGYDVGRLFHQFAMLGTEERVLQLRVLPRGPVLDGMWGLGSLRPSLVDTKTLKKRL